MLELLKLEMQKQGLWSPSPPVASAFESTAPFCIDTMSLEQWLQFVFIPKSFALLNSGASFPANVAISPLAEEVYKNNLFERQAIISILKELEAASARQQ